MKKVRNSFYKFILLGFLEIINNLLTGTGIPALFADEEKEGIINELQQEATEAGYEQNKESIWGYFCRKAARNLHIVLAMSPVSEST